MEYLAGNKRYDSTYKIIINICIKLDIKTKINILKIKLNFLFNWIIVWRIIFAGDVKIFTTQLYMYRKWTAPSHEALENFGLATGEDKRSVVARVVCT